MAPAVTLRSAVALLGRFPVLAGVDLDVEEGTVARGARPERRRQDEPPAPARGPPRAAQRGGHGPWLRPRVRPPRAAPPGRAPRPPAGPVPGALGHGEPRLRASAPRADPTSECAARPRARRALRRLAPASRRGRCRPASSGGWGSRGWWRGDPRCGSSTSRPRDSTARAGRCATSSSRRPREAARPSRSRATTPRARPRSPTSSSSSPAARSPSVRTGERANRVA